MKYIIFFLAIISLTSCTQQEIPNTPILPREVTTLTPTERGLTPYYFTGTTFKEEEFSMSWAVSVEILMRRDCFTEEREFLNIQDMNVVTDIVAHDCIAYKYERYPSERYKITFSSWTVWYFYKQVYKSLAPEIIPDEDIIFSHSR